MQREIELTTTSYVVLGLVATTPGCTSYDMKRIVRMSIGNFWSFPHTSLYTEPARLVDAGLLSMRQEEGGRRRRSFFVTVAGSEALKDWLSESSGDIPELRYPALLKLYFARVAPTAMTDLAAAQVEGLSESLLGFKAMNEQYAARVDVAPQVATLRLGIALNEAALAFWRSVLADPPGAHTPENADEGKTRERSR